MKMYDVNGKLTTPMKWQHPMKRNTPLARFLIQSHAVLNSFNFAITGIDILHNLFELDSLDIEGGDARDFGKLADAIEKYTRSMECALVANSIAGDNQELKNLIAKFIVDAIHCLNLLNEADYSNLSYNAGLHKEAMGILAEPGSHNLSRIRQGLELLAMSYLVEVVDFGSIVSCQGSYLDECSKMN